MSLLRLGFHPLELANAKTWPDGRVGLYGEHAGERALFQVSTNVDRSLTLRGSFVHHHELPVQQKEDSWGVCDMGRLTVLNRSYTPGPVLFSGGSHPDYGRTYAGVLGMSVFRESILGLDAADPGIALSVRPDVRNSFDQAIARIPLTLDNEDGLPVTSVVTDENAPDGTPLFLLGTTAPSCIFLSYASDHWSGRRLRRSVERAHRKGEDLEVPLRLPGGITIRQRMQVEIGSSAYIGSAGNDELAGVLGFEFLRRWMMVFDFSGLELALFAY